jgi:hypothetical protein
LGNKLYGHKFLMGREFVNDRASGLDLAKRLQG